MNSTGTVIGKGICIRGEISGSEDFFLDGMVEGNIALADKRLTVGANGLVQADIVAGDLSVFGRVEGSVRVSARAELKRNAAFIGDITAARLSVEDDAPLQGYVDLTGTEGAEKLSAKAEMPEAVEPQYQQAV